MSIHCEEKGGIFFTTVTGTFDCQSAIEHLDFLCTHKGRTENLYEFHDYSNIEKNLLSQQELIDIAEYAKKIGTVYKRSFVAVYAPGDLAFGMARQYQANAAMRDNKTLVEIYRDKNQAIQSLVEKARKFR